MLKSKFHYFQACVVDVRCVLMYILWICVGAHSEIIWTRLGLVGGLFGDTSAHWGSFFRFLGTNLLGGEMEKQD
jgi:hypothetical protein